MYMHVQAFIHKQGGEASHTSTSMATNIGTKRRGSLRTLKSERATKTLAGVSSYASEWRWTRTKVTKVAKDTCGRFEVLGNRDRVETPLTWTPWKPNTSCVIQVHIIRTPCFIHKINM